MTKKDRLARIAVALAGLAIFLFDDRQGIYVLFAIMAVSAFVFVSAYVARSKWKSTRQGRELLYCALTVGLWTGHLSLKYWFDVDYPGWMKVQLLLFYLFELAMLNITWTLLKTQNDQIALRKRGNLVVESKGHVP